MVPKKLGSKFTFLQQITRVLISAHMLTNRQKMKLNKASRAPIHRNKLVISMWDKATLF